MGRAANFWKVCCACVLFLSGRGVSTTLVTVGTADDLIRLYVQGWVHSFFGHILYPNLCQLELIS